MVRILHLISGTDLGGPKTVFLSYNSLFRLLNYSVTSVLRPGAKLAQYVPEEETIYTNYYRTALPILRLIMSKIIKSLIDKNRPDYIVVHKPIDAFLCRLASPSAYIILVVHGFQKQYLENASALIAVSRPVLNHLEFIGYNKAMLIPNFLDFPVTTHNISWHTPIKFGALGYYRRKKGFTDFLKALYLLENKTKAFEAHLCGRGTLGPIIKFMSKYYYKLKVFQIHEWKQDANKWMRGMDVIVVPSRSESFGMVVIEAMANGALVIATRSGGPESIIIDGETGILVPPRDPEALCRAMLSIIQDPEKWNKVRINGRNMVEKRYNIGNAVRNMERVFSAQG